MHLRPPEQVNDPPCRTVFRQRREGIEAVSIDASHADMAVWVRKMRTGDGWVPVTAHPVPAIKNCTVRAARPTGIPEMTAVSRNDATPLAQPTDCLMSFETSTNLTSGNSLTNCFSLAIR